VQIYDGLDYRHWDTWNEGKFNHVLYKETNEGCSRTYHGQRKDSPQSLLVETKINGLSKILYVSKKKGGLHMPFQLTPVFLNIA
jgi:hypothetical protein